MSVTVRELIEHLQKHDPDDIVIMSSDPEGNGYLPFYSMAPMIYSTKWGDVYERELTEEMKSRGYTEEDDLYHGEDGVNALVLWP